MIEAIVFDMDGLLIDSEPWWQVAETAAFASVGVTLSEESCLETVGLRIDEAVQYHWDRTGGWKGKNRQEVTDSIIKEMENLLREKAEAMPGAAAAVARVRSKAGAGARRLKVGLASSSPMVLIRAGLSRLGLKEEDFDAVCSAEQEELGKPHPAVYISAATALNVRPDRCLAIEDSLNGVIAAKAGKI